MRTPISVTRRWSIAKSTSFLIMGVRRPLPLHLLVEPEGPAAGDHVPGEEALRDPHSVLVHGLHGHLPLLEGSRFALGGGLRPDEGEARLELPDDGFGRHDD